MQRVKLARVKIAIALVSIWLLELTALKMEIENKRPNLIRIK